MYDDEAARNHSATTGVYFGGRAKLFACSRLAEERGVLLPFYFDQMPFPPCRAFIVTNVPAGTVRGGHAHRSETQMLVCLQGRIDILMRHGDEEVTVVMKPTSPGLVLGPGVWSEQKYIAEGSVLLAFSNDPYDPKSYVQHVS